MTLTKKERDHRWYLRHKEKHNETCKKYYYEHREELLQKSRERWPRYKDRQKELSIIRNHKLRQKLIKEFGGKCIRCGFSDWRALQFDHKEGSGNKDRKNKGSFAQTKNIMNNRDKFLLLCANCNWIKRYERREHR